MNKTAVFCLLGLCLCLLLTGCGQSHAAPSPTPAPTPRSGELVTTAPPGTTPTPQETPAPPEETAEPGGPAAPLDESGSLRSDTGTNLNLQADWRVTAVSAQNVRLTVVLWLESYSLSVGERQLNTLRVNDETYTFQTDPVEVPSGGGDKTFTQLYEWSETLPLGADGGFSAELEAVWNFQGSYSGTELETVTVGGRIAVNE